MTDNEQLKTRLAELEKENAKLKVQVEKMKCCANCKNYIDSKFNTCDIRYGCKNLSKWLLNK